MRPRQITVAVFLALYAAQGVAADNGTALEEILVTARRILTPGFGAMGLDSAEIARKRARTSDTASLLAGLPGVSVYGAGGVSSLPVIRGLADDRLRTQVDGMDLVAACPNHMNSPLSYIDPTAVANIDVYAGVTPVSVGGDSIGGSIVVRSADPAFAQPGAHLLKGEAGTFYRSNIDGWGGNLSGTLRHREPEPQLHRRLRPDADNYQAGDNFKNYTFTGRPGHTLPTDEVGSSAYRIQQPGRPARLAEWRSPAGLHLWFPGHPVRGLCQPAHGHDGEQERPVQSCLHRQPRLGNPAGAGLLPAYRARNGFRRRQAVLVRPRATASGSGGDTAINGTPCSPISGSMMVSGQMVGCAAGMPMRTDGKNTGVTVSAAIPLAEQSLLRVGGEYQENRLDDWWPPSGAACGPTTS